MFWWIFKYNCLGNRGMKCRKMTIYRCHPIFLDIAIIYCIRNDQWQQNFIFISWNSCFNIKSLEYTKLNNNRARWSCCVNVMLLYKVKRWTYKQYLINIIWYVRDVVIMFSNYALEYNYLHIIFAIPLYKLHISKY